MFDAESGLFWAKRPGYGFFKQAWTLPHKNLEPIPE